MVLLSQPTTTISPYSSITQPTTMPRVSLPTHGAASLMLPITRQRKHIAPGRNADGLRMRPTLAHLRCRMSMWSTRFKTLLTGPA
jgi:hypothetical protein